MDEEEEKEIQEDEADLAAYLDRVLADSPD